MHWTPSPTPPESPSKSRSCPTAPSRRAPPTTSSVVKRRERYFRSTSTRAAGSGAQRRGRAQGKHTTALHGPATRDLAHAAPPGRRRALGGPGGRDAGEHPVPHPGGGRSTDL